MHNLMSSLRIVNSFTLVVSYKNYLFNIIYVSLFVGIPNDSMFFTNLLSDSDIDDEGINNQQGDLMFSDGVPIQEGMFF